MNLDYLDYLILAKLIELPNNTVIKATALLQKLSKIIVITKLNARLKSLRVQGYVQRYVKDGQIDDRWLSDSFAPGYWKITDKGRTKINYIMNEDRL